MFEGTTQTNQKNNFRVSFGSADMGINPDQDGPASKLTMRHRCKHWRQEGDTNEPSGIFDPSTKNFAALGFEKDIVGLSGCRFGSPPESLVGPRKSCSRSICWRWISIASSNPCMAPPIPKAGEHREMKATRDKNFIINGNEDVESIEHRTTSLITAPGMRCILGNSHLPIFLHSEDPEEGRTIWMHEDGIPLDLHYNV